MTVRDINRVIIVTDCLTGQVIATIDKDLYSRSVINSMIENLFDNDYDNENGIMIKYGYKS